MIFRETNVIGAFAVEPEPIVDSRGFFSRLWCEEEFRDRGLNVNIRQTNLAYSPRRGTLRGLHFQQSPFAEVKLIRCTRGAVFDVVVDLRPDSKSHRQWYGIELTSENRIMLYVPAGCATGYITMARETEIYYHTSEFYRPEVASGVRYNDPAFAIQWPLEVEVISEQDRSWPDYREERSQ